MKKLFYLGALGLALFEILNVYFIMPMPGSQQMDSIDVAYFLYNWRWGFRIVFTVLIFLGAKAAFEMKWKWIPSIVLVVALLIAYMFNFQMAADQMFMQPEHLVLKSSSENDVPTSQLVIGVEHGGEAKAYPIEYLTYHHQVQDSIGGEPMMITYCSVCRTGRVFQPFVDGQYEKFRLVGMDHFNAMFEDATTKSWWRQANGEAITGELKGTLLPEVPSYQMSIEKWFERYPDGLVMQPDRSFLDEYDSLAKYEQGKSTSDLTGTDSLSWKEKSWVVGVVVGDKSKAYDWNDLKQSHIINDYVGAMPIVLALSDDEKSFVAFERPEDRIFTIQDDMIVADSLSFDFSGVDRSHDEQLKPVQAYQEFWHSWRTFKPDTERYLP